jgi:predicted GNAT family N-acyltransferase
LTAGLAIETCQEIPFYQPGKNRKFIPGNSQDAVMEPANGVIKVMKTGVVGAEQRLEIEHLVNQAWPAKPGRDSWTFEKSLQYDDATCRHLLYILDGKVRGYAKIFRRIIRDEIRAWNNMALAGVCVERAWRNREIGRGLIKKAFGFVESRYYEICIFQTPHLRFYQRLGAVKVSNPFINSLKAVKKNQVWWDPHIMLYALDEKPRGIIDMLGSAY